MIFYKLLTFYHIQDSLFIYVYITKSKTFYLLSNDKSRINIYFVYLFWTTRELKITYQIIFDNIKSSIFWNFYKV